jgi:hypothetical protein
MRIYKDCNVKMREVMSFSKEKRERFPKCPIYFDESEHKAIEKNDFDEILKREIDNRR